MGDEKNRLTETVLLSTHNLCFGLELRKLVFDSELLSGGLHSMNILLTNSENSEQTVRWTIC